MLQNGCSLKMQEWYAWSIMKHLAQWIAEVPLQQKRPAYTPMPAQVGFAGQEVDILCDVAHFTDGYATVCLTFFKSSWSVFKKNEDIYDAHVDLCRAMLECAWSLFQSQLWSLFKLIRILDYLSVLLNLNHCRLVMIDWCLFPAGQFCLLQLPHTVTPFSNFHSLFLRSGDVCGIDFGTTNCRVALWQDGGATQHREFVTISCPK